MAIIKLPRLISDGVVFQRNKEIRIWGWTESESACIEVELGKDNNGSFETIISKKAAVSVDKRFDAVLDKMAAGGPYELRFLVDSNVVSTVKNVMIGELLQLVGQSNIEFPMSRVLETYPEELVNPENDMIRTFKVVENRVFDGPVVDNETGEWVNVNKESLPDYSAIGYFTAKAITSKENIAVGLINTTLGGATIESWQGADMLGNDEDAKKELALYKDEAYRNGVLKQNEATDKEWYDLLASTDIGLKEQWYLPETDTSDWKKISIPCYISENDELNNFNGAIWLKRTFTANKEMCDKDCKLWFGTIIDADEIYVNGQLVGHTEYCYPPRRYTIDKGILKEGENDITIRIKVEKFGGRVTDGKVYAIFTGDVKRECDGYNESVIGAENFTKLDGEWKYKIGAIMPMRKDVVFVSWKPTALYNGMLAPCTNMNVKAVIWYQGESNAESSEKYFDQFSNLVEGYRRAWKDSNLPFIYIQLPEYMDKAGSLKAGGKNIIDWPKMMEAQKKCLEIHDTFMIEALGTGEYNDLHPQRKKTLGDKIAECIMNEL